jgi:hypothetical protein
MSARLTARLNAGCGAFGAPFVKFTLTYDGPLPPSANKPKSQEKWDIRKSFAPQLEDLWSSHPALIHIEKNERYFFTGNMGSSLHQRHHSDPGPLVMSEQNKARADDGEPNVMDLCRPIEKHGAWFRPLMRDSFALHCGLKILFLRKEPPGKVYQGGDIDGRMKTLLDSLAMPQNVEQIKERTSTQFAPVFACWKMTRLSQELTLKANVF